MCLAIPAKIISKDNLHAVVETRGILHKVNIGLIDTPSPGDYILVHAGFAIEKIDLEYFDFLNDKLYEILEGTEDGRQKDD